MGRLYWGIQKLLAQENGDHGASLGFIGYQRGENKEIVSGGYHDSPQCFYYSSGGNMGWIHYSYDADRRGEAIGVYNRRDNIR